ncbi:MAG: pimeloyl-ACP methyl ester carboxylesterase [Sulfitobacter sp.]|jgi:pimeloyl-ACP methyl ester carboxylesterase
MPLDHAKTFALAGLMALSGCTSLPESEAGAVARGLTPPLGQFLVIDGKRVHVHLVGPENAPVVILLHGASGNLRDFTFDFVPRLANNLRVISFDRPGLGYSDRLHKRGESPTEQALHLARAAEALGVDRAVIVGHSYGASVAMAWALERPDMAAAVVSLGGAVNPWPGGLGAWYAITASWLGGATVVPVIAALLPRSVASTSVSAIFEPDPVPDGYLDYIGADLTLRASALRANARQVGGLKPYVTQMSARYPTLDLPVEILHGALDDTVPLMIHSEPLSRATAGANLVILDGVGHMPHHARPDETVAAIWRAVRRAGLRGTAHSR